ncbi:triose-phosphate isomerase [Candidatus Parcubacteria bacterium]|nr:MAG: triose-phosphate isomerase [Candidatus Parcubacteria bacterium]
MSKEKIIIANWKMKISLSESKQLAQDLIDPLKEIKGIEIAVAPNFLSVCDVADILKDTSLKICSQDAFWEQQGAYTGEISPQLLKEAGCEFIIIGHSERRKFMMENYEMIHKKTKLVLETEGVTPVVCIGENWDERKTDRRDFVLFDQLQQALGGLKFGQGDRIIVAYEPIWAIGSGTAIEPAEAEYAHKVIRLTLNDMFGKDVVDENFQIIYGGSINSSNVVGFLGLENIDGMLVGGASLNAEEFAKVIKSFNK